MLQAFFLLASKLKTYILAYIKGRFGESTLSYFHVTFYYLKSDEVSGAASLLSVVPRIFQLLSPLK